MTDATTPRGSMSPTRRLKIFERHFGRCCLCESKIKAGDTWTIEHIRALALGGADEDSNCAPAHEACRRLKDKKDMASIAKSKRMKARHYGIRKLPSMPGSRNTKWKKHFDGRVTLR